MEVAPAVLEVLTAASVEGQHLALTGPRMDPGLYRQVREVLESVGGQWNRASQAYRFSGDAATAIAPVLADKQVTTQRELIVQAQYFPTPELVVDRMLEFAAIFPGTRVLEPSAGHGAIAAAVAARGGIVDCIEQDPGRARLITDTGAAASVLVADFLAVAPQPHYDFVLMNPPFAGGADIAHVQHALKFLKPEGLLVAIMSLGVTYRSGAAASFRQQVDQVGGHVEPLPENAFRSSGTTVDTILVSIPAIGIDGAPRPVWDVPQRPRRAAVEQNGLGDALDDEHRDPAELAREIADDLRRAVAIMDDLYRDLSSRSPGSAATALESVSAAEMATDVEQQPRIPSPTGVDRGLGTPPYSDALPDPPTWLDAVVDTTQPGVRTATTNVTAAAALPHPSSTATTDAAATTTLTLFDI